MQHHVALLKLMGLPNLDDYMTLHHCYNPVFAYFNCIVGRLYAWDATGPLLAPETADGERQAAPRGDSE